MKSAAFAVLAALAIAVPATVSAPARAAETIAVKPFKTIEVHGGGEVILRHGDTQRVTLLEGDPKIAEIRVVGDGRLELSPCRRTCWGDHELKVEVTTPAIAGLTAHGGGSIDAKSGFGNQPRLAIEVHGGGDVDARAIPADAVSANVHGGGTAKVTANKSLHAEVHGGGSLRYWGHPRIDSEVHGGGSLESGE